MSTEKRLPSAIALALIAAVFVAFASSLADGWFRVFAIIGAVVMLGLAGARIAADLRSRPRE